MVQKKEKNNVQRVIDALLTGQPLRSRDIADMIRKTGKKNIKTRGVSSVLSRLTNAEHCDLAHFIARAREGNVFTYAMVADALQLSQDQAYGLTLKEGDDKYPLPEALSDYPALRKYVGSDAAKMEAAAAPEQAAPAPTEKTPEPESEPEQAAASTTAAPVVDAVSFQKTLMTMYIDALTLTLDQAEALAESMLDGVPWVSAEVKKGLRDSMGLCRDACTLLKKAASFSFDEMTAAMDQDPSPR
jgi:predicted transcriptional regulator